MDLFASLITGIIDNVLDAVEQAPDNVFRGILGDPE